MVKVSVIIPVYGVEKYIERCARSLFEQTLDYIEFIFVDDCSPDNSMAVLEKVILDYPERREQITILHHNENKGLPRTRQTGLSVAKGDYIAHCDSDDWVDLGMYNQMYETAIQKDADLVVCDYEVTDGHSYHKRRKSCYNTNCESFIIDSLFQRAPWSLCNKLFRRTVYNEGLIYPEKNVAEDMALTSQLLLRCRKIEYVEEAFYKYYWNPESMTKKINMHSVLQNFYAAKENTDIVLKVYSGNKMKKVKEGLIFIQYNAKAHLFPIIHYKEYRSIFCNTYPHVFAQMITSFSIPIKCKLKYIWTVWGLYPNKVNKN